MFFIYWKPSSRSMDGLLGSSPEMNVILLKEKLRIYRLTKLRQAVLKNKRGQFKQLCETADVNLWEGGAHVCVKGRRWALVLRIVRVIRKFSHGQQNSQYNYTFQLWKVSVNNPLRQDGIPNMIAKATIRTR